jgi:hypothetical protein
MAAYHLAPVVDRMLTHLKRSGRLFMDSGASVIGYPILGTVRNEGTTASQPTSGPEGGPTARPSMTFEITQAEAPHIRAAPVPGCQNHEDDL